MDQLNIKKVSLYGFVVLIFGSLLSGLILVSLIFRIDAIKDEQQVTESAYDSLFEFKYYTERLLTSGDLEKEQTIWEKSARQFESNLQQLKYLRGEQSEEFNKLWHVIKIEVGNILNRLKNPLFQAKNTMRKSLLRRLGEGLNANEQSDYYVALTALTNNIGYLKQYEDFLMDELRILKEEHEREIEQRLDNTRNLALILPTVILLFTVVFALMISRRVGRLEGELTTKKNELRRLNKNLKAEIARQINEIRNKDEILIIQSKQLALGEMLGNIAHQWRQPLNALGLHIQDVLDAYEFQELDEAYLKEITDKSMRIIHQMSDTIDDFRTFYEPQKAKGNFNIRQMLKEVQKLVLPQLEALRISLEIGEGDAAVYGYSNEFKQVILNIVNNAKDAITKRTREEGLDAGQIRIILREEKANVSIYIDDNGGGIDGAIMEKIFEPYFTTKFKSQGTGIGLYMSKSIIEHNMGGKIYAENIDGGARFAIELPRSADREE